MDKKSELLQLIPQQGILPLYFYKDTEVSIQVLKALFNAGIRTVEYTNRGEAALKNFKEMRRVCDSELQGMYLGGRNHQRQHGCAIFYRCRRRLYY